MRIASTHSRSARSCGAPVARSAASERLATTAATRTRLALELDKRCSVGRRLLAGAARGTDADDRRVAQVGDEPVPTAQLVVERLQHRQVELLVPAARREHQVLVWRF